jgi:predicted histone-like DNA-binding protein
MIDYSVYLQSNPLDETAAPKAYAKAQMRELMTFDKFINHIASHNGGFSRGMVKGIVSDTCSCVVEQLLEGKKVQFGELGSFWLSLSCEGAESLEEFTAKNITGVNIIFTPGPDFENLISKCEFNVVASRVAQAATLKAEKTGATVVDLEAARAAARPNSNSSGSGTDNSGSGDSTTGDDNTGGSSEGTGTTEPGNSGSTDSGNSGTTPSGGTDTPQGGDDGDDTNGQLP